GGQPSLVAPHRRGVQALAAQASSRPAQPLNTSLAARTAAKAAASPARRNGLVAFSRAMVVGTVGSPRARAAKTSSARAFSAGPSSMESAKRALEAVYSCAQ